MCVMYILVRPLLIYYICVTTFFKSSSCPSSQHYDNLPTLPDKLPNSMQVLITACGYITNQPQVISMSYGHHLKLFLHVTVVNLIYFLSFTIPSAIKESAMSFTVDSGGVS